MGRECHEFWVLGSMCIDLDHVVECCPSQLQDSTLTGSYVWLYKLPFITGQPSHSPNIFQYYFARKSWLNIHFVAITYLGLLYVSISWGEFPFLEVRLRVVTLEPVSKLMLSKIATLDIFKAVFSTCRASPLCQHFQPRYSCLT